MVECEPETEDAAWLVVPVLFADADTYIMNNRRIDKLCNTYEDALWSELDAAWAPRTKKRAKKATAVFIVLDKSQRGCNYRVQLGLA